MGRSIIRRFRLIAAALTVSAGGASAQSPGRVIPPLPDTLLQRIAAEIALPPGFDMRLVAAPPHLTYPVCVAPGGPGILYVCTDPNLNLDRERRRGRILRFVDENGDGTADRYTVFADSLDSVRGLILDGETLYAMHAPTFVALRDTDGDGVADEERVLVDGLGFTLDDRGGDHTSNGITLGIDGWIYIAMGDYGFEGATGSDGTQLRLHGGGVVRVRPDGSELEIVARGTRNIYDLGIDPYLRIFARDNTNNGQGWNSRLHYLPTGVNAGYPALFRNFPEEIHPPLIDYGAGAATTALWIDEPGFDAAPTGSLFTADWALGRIYRHSLTPRGATFAVTQEEFMGLPRPAHMELDAAGDLFIASLSGGSYTYAGEHVGYIVRLRAAEAGSPPVPADSVDEAALVGRIIGPSAAARLDAQRELLRRGATAAGVSALERAMLNRELAATGRVAALFTLKQLLGEESHGLLLLAVEDPVLRAMALRALTDRRGELGGVPSAPFVAALADADPFVRLQAVTGLARLGAPDAAGHLLLAAASADSVVAHVARNALVEMGAVSVALRALDSAHSAERAAGLQVLERLHFPTVVSALMARAEAEPDPPFRRSILGALARLYHREAVWRGEWWNNQPNTEGPYYAPVQWEESARIRPIFVEALRDAGEAELGLLAAVLEREGVVPRGAAALIPFLGGEGDDRRDIMIDGLVQGRELHGEALSLLDGLYGSDPSSRPAIAAMLTAPPLPLAAAADLIRRVTADRDLPAEPRAEALAALGRIPGEGASALNESAHAALTAELPADPLLLQAWRRFAGDRRRIAELEHYAVLTAARDDGERILGYAVLVQIAGTVRNPEPSRTRASALIEAGWGDPVRAAALVRAINLLGFEERYAEQLAAHPVSPP